MKRKELEVGMKVYKKDKWNLDPAHWKQHIVRDVRPFKKSDLGRRAGYPVRSGTGVLVHEGFEGGYERVVGLGSIFTEAQRDELQVEYDEGQRIQSEYKRQYHEAQLQAMDEFAPHAKMLRDLGVNLPTEVLPTDRTTMSYQSLVDLIEKAKNGGEPS